MARAAFVAALAVGGTAAANVQSAFATESDPVAPCQLEGVVLTCGTGREVITRAMANPESRKVISDRALVERIVENGLEREAFRRSLEGNRRQLVRFANARLRDLKRRRISAAKYEEHKALYNEAMETYKAGLLTYRYGIWLRKNR